MKDSIKKLTFIILLATLTVSCGDLSSDERENEPVYSEQVRSLNGVLHIQNGGASSYGRSDYEVGTQKRILLRLENLGELSGNVVIDDTHRMMFELNIVKAADVAAAKANFKLCPLLKNWMMLASWTHAHPFPGGSGPWGTPGGDFHQAECIETSQSLVDPDPSILKFDVSDWFVHYQQSRSSNFGWVLISEIDGINVYGDSHISKAPKLKWQEFIR
jgi:hypothetical protein